MSTPTVIEARIQLEPVTADPFVADLDLRSADAELRLVLFAERAAASPNRRLVD